MNSSTKNHLLLLSFIEGATVMAAELMGAKMLAPFFGSSLYVWSAVMAITLGGLAVGYFIGGRMSARKNKEIILYNVLLTAALFTVLMPYTSSLVLSIFGLWDLLWAVSVSALVLLFPPVFLMGAVSPLIIGNYSESSEDPGKAAGTVYAVSTTGGILATFLFGFYVIPNFGLTFPSIFMGLLLGLLPFISLLRKKYRKSTSHFGVIVVLAAVQIYLVKYGPNRPAPGIEILHKEEGILGEVLVMDIANDLEENHKEKTRWLYVNRISQTKDNKFANEDKNEERYFSYVYRFSELLEQRPVNKRKVLLLGLGGGSIASHLSQKGFEVDVCEFDRRIVRMAKKYFDMPETIKVTVDDARHHVKSLTEKYDVVIFDTFRGEVTPDHLITKESLAEVKKVLRQDGLLLINSFNHIEGEKGIGLRAIFNTLEYSDFTTSIWPSGLYIEDRNLLFIASLTAHPSHPDFMKTAHIDFSDAPVLSDEYPSFEVLNAEAGLAWRQWAINNYF